MTACYSRRPPSQRRGTMAFRPWPSVLPRRQESARHGLSLDPLEARSLPSVAPLPTPGGPPGFPPDEFFEHANLAGPADAPAPFGNEPSSITNFIGLVGVA